MAKTHDRDGSNALLSYDLSKGPELENPLDPGSRSTGSTRYVLSEVYSSPAAIEDHWRLTQESWSDFGAMVEMLASCQTQTLHCGSITQSLWSAPTHRSRARNQVSGAASRAAKHRHHASRRSSSVQAMAYTTATNRHITPKPGQGWRLWA